MTQQITKNQDAKKIAEFLGVPEPSFWRRNRNRILIVMAVIVVVILLRIIFGSDTNKIQYATEVVKKSNMLVTVIATGNLQPTNQVVVGSEISGLVTEVLVDNNDVVRKGQLLARIDNSRLTETLNQSKAALLSAQASQAQEQATVRQRKASLARYEEVYRLSGGKVPSVAEFDIARADHARSVAALRVAEANVSRARADLSSNTTQFGKASIVSPVNGVVLSRSIDPGQTVAASFNAPVLFQIAENLSRMRLEVKVDEADVGQVSKGQTARFEVDAFPGREFMATVERVDVGSNSNSASVNMTGTVISYVALLGVDNKDLALRPGMTASATITTVERKNVLLVPNAALRFTPPQASKKAGLSILPTERPGESSNKDVDSNLGRGSRRTIYVLGENEEIKPVAVVLSFSNGSMTEVNSDELKPGMKVITGQLAKVGK
jgi:HlyD family secretion protein